MPLPTISSPAGYTADERYARESGFEDGYNHANCVNAYGESDAEYAKGLQVPDRFRHVEHVWLEAYQDGEDEFAADFEEA